MAGCGVRTGKSLWILLAFGFLWVSAGRGWAQVPENPQPQNEPKADQSQGQKKEEPLAGQEPAEQTPSDQSSQATPPPGKKDQSSNPAQAVAGGGKGATQSRKQMAQATLGRMRDWETEWLVGAYVGRNGLLIAQTGKQRQEIYLQQTLLTPGAYLKRMFDATIDQERGVPAQWDDGWAGYAERWASREGQFIAANSLAALGDATLGYEPRYDQCRCRGVWPRTRHVIVRNFLTYDRTEQRRRPQWALYGGAFGGGVISTTWKPRPRNAFAEGGRAMACQAGWGVLFNFFTEFALDINRKLGSKK